MDFRAVLVAVLGPLWDPLWAHLAPLRASFWASKMQNATSIPPVNRPTPPLGLSVPAGSWLIGSSRLLAYRFLFACRFLSAAWLFDLSALVGLLVCRLFSAYWPIVPYGCNTENATSIPPLSRPIPPSYQSLMAATCSEHSASLIDFLGPYILLLMMYGTNFKHILATQAASS
jgi:hypothetical protein